MNQIAVIVIVVVLVIAAVWIIFGSLLCLYKNIKSAGGDSEEEKAEAERIKAIFTNNAFREGQWYKFMDGPDVRIIYANYWPHMYEVIIEWIDKNHTYNKATIHKDIKKVLKPISHGKY